MSGNAERIRTLIGEEASEWYVTNAAGPSSDQRRAFACWLKSSPVHVEEYLAISATARDLRNAGAPGPGVVADLVTRARNDSGGSLHPLGVRFAGGAPDAAWRRSRRPLLAAAGIGAFALALWWGALPERRLPAAEPIVQEFTTRHGEQRVETLSDGSIIHLNTDTAVSVRYAATERVVTLRQGEANFEVTPGRSRPFRVAAGSSDIVAIGTQFDVQLGRHTTLVTVIEGRVSIGHHQAPAVATPRAGQSDRLAVIELAAGQQVRIADSDWPATPVTVDPRRETAWLRRQIIFERTPLESVASEFNRYAPKRIEITTPALRSLQISGVFATDNVDAFVAFLRSLDGVRVELDANVIRVSKN